MRSGRNGPSCLDLGHAHGQHTVNRPLAPRQGLAGDRSQGRSPSERHGYCAAGQRQLPSRASRVRSPQRRNPVFGRVARKGPEGGEDPNRATIPAWLLACGLNRDERQVRSGGDLDTSRLNCIS